MKRVVLSIYSIIFLLSMLNSQAFSQCNTELFTNKSIRKLDNGFQFSKSFRVNGRRGSRKVVEYTCVLSRNTSYMVKISGQDGNARGVISTLSDSKNNKLISSYYNNKFSDGWEFKCNSTGIYRITFIFNNSRSYCAAAVLAFRK